MDNRGKADRKSDLPGIKVLPSASPPPPPLVGENMWGIRLCGINPRSVLVYKSKIARHYMPLDEMQYKVHSTTYKIFSSKTFHPNLVKPLDTLPNYRKYSR